MRSTVLAFLLLSARGGVAALAAWLVCRALRRAHAPSRFLCWLWLAVGLRFVLPWGIPLKLPRPESAPLAAAADTVQELGELPLLPPAPAAAAAAAPLPWYARLTPWHALAAVWLVGVLVLAVRGAVGYLKLKRCVALACKTPDGCYGGACVPTPFTLGFVRPRVYLPDSLQGPARQAVLLHERTHIRRRDPLVKPLFYAVVCLHWFNPLAWLALCAFEHDMEAACDEAAVQGCTLAERSTYCESLLQFAMQGRPIRTPGSLAFGQGSVKERIVHLLHYRRLGAGALALCAVAVGVSVTACMVRPQVEASHAAPEPPAATSETAAPTPTPAPTETPAAMPAATLPTLSDAANSPRFVCPVKYKYISRFATKYSHRGDDLCAAEGTEIYAAADGVVLAAQEHYSWGNFVEIDHGTDADGLRWVTLYAHMKSCAVQVGQTVTAGQVIGYVGSTGNTTGNACHFEMHVNGTLVEPRYFTAYEGSDAAALEQARAAADEAARQAADAKAALEQQQAALADTQTALEAALLNANSTLTAQQAAAQAQAAVTDAAKKAYEDATAALDAYVREQSRRYTTADLHLTSLDFRCPLDSYGRITTQFAEPDPWGIPHRGTDFAAPGGTPIYAIADGVVSAARTMNS